MNELFSNTPTIKINYKFNNEVKFIYVKLKRYSLTGSIKD